MSPRDHDQPFTAHAGAITTATALVDTTLDEARVVALHPSRLVVVGSGRRVRVDSVGATTQQLTDLRLSVPLAPAVTGDAGLAHTLGRWAALGTALHLHEQVCAGERFERVVSLCDDEGGHAIVRNR